MVDWSFIATIGVIFFASLLGAWLRSRRRDACLASFGGFHVTLEMVDGRRVWGVMDVLPTGLEFYYRDAVRDDQHLESSFLLYNDEFEQIQSFFRYADDLSPARMKKRQKAIQRAFHPNILRKLARKTRNFISTASASLNDILGMALGRVRKPAGRFIDETSEAHLKQLGTNVIGHVGLQADPLLERLIGTKIVFETIEDGVVHEHVGIFKEYTRDFYEILDVQFPCHEFIPLEQQRTNALAGLEVTAENDIVTIRNQGLAPVLVLSLKTRNQEQYLDVVVDAGGEVIILPEFEFTQATLHARVVRELDMILPRTRAIIRHRAEALNKVSLTDIIFDLGVRLPSANKDMRQEQELRRKLKKNPHDVNAMAVLGGQLLQRQELDEAEDWLHRAHAMRFSLPDNGRGVELHLRELQRKRQRQKNTVPRSAEPTAPDIDLSIAVLDSADSRV